MAVSDELDYSYDDIYGQNEAKRKEALLAQQEASSGGWTPFQNMAGNVGEGKGWFGREGGIGSGLLSKLFKNRKNSDVLALVSQIANRANRPGYKTGEMQLSPSPEPGKYYKGRDEVANNLDIVAQDWFNRKRKEQAENTNIQEDAQNRLKGAYDTPTMPEGGYAALTGGGGATDEITGGEDVEGDIVQEKVETKAAEAAETADDLVGNVNVEGEKDSGRAAFLDDYLNNLVFQAFQYEYL